ncbi:MAG: hypothetical protein AB3N14_08625, partial [Flavobacteriaceae bacterium]
MTNRVSSIFPLILLFIVISCKQVDTNRSDQIANKEIAIEQEKKAILQTLNNETKAAFQRDYDAWQEKWVHDPNITKTYLDFTDDTFSESVGWEEISQFVKTFIEEHPEPEPVP